MTRIDREVHALLDRANAPAPDIDIYFANLDAKLNGIALDSTKIVTIGNEIRQWERKQECLAKWASCKTPKENPYSPPLDAFTCSVIITRLSRMLCEAHDRRAAIVAAAHGRILQAAE